MSAHGTEIDINEPDQKKTFTPTTTLCFFLQSGLTCRKTPTRNCIIRKFEKNN